MFRLKLQLSPMPELRDKDGTMISLYRSRIIVLGKSIKVRMLDLDKPYYHNGSSGRIRVVLGPSPDQYTKPIAKNYLLNVTLSDNDKEIFSGSRLIPELSDQTGLIMESFEFNSSEESGDLKICAEVHSSENELYEKYCYAILASQVTRKPEIIETNWSYDSGRKEILVKMCAKDRYGGLVNGSAAALISSKGTGNLIAARDNISITPCADINLPLEPGNYSLTVNNLETNRQWTYDVSAIDAVEEADANYLKVIAVLMALLLAAAIAVHVKKTKYGHKNEGAH
jgi:hypothetical protein